MKILVPVSFLTALLAWSGMLESLEGLIRPAMGWLSLPPAAALPLIIGVLTNIYGAIAAMAVLPFSSIEITLMAVFLLSAHALIQEGVVQSQSGLRPVKAAAVRLVSAAVTVKATAFFIGAGAAGPKASAAAAMPPLSFYGMLAEWLTKTASLGVSVFVMIMIIMTFMEAARSFGWIDPVVRLCRPILKLLGLEEKAGVIWMAAAVFGLLYSAALIVEEAQNGGFESAELEQLQVSIGINHSMVEDPALFLAIGAHAFWLYVPRLAAAIVAVQIMRVLHSRGCRVPAAS